MLQIIGYILYFILLFITFGWVLGVRFKSDVGYHTVLGSIYFVVLCILLPLARINYLHLLWLIPLVYLLTLLNIYIWIYRVPLLTTLFSMICDVYTAILRIGMDQAEIRRKRELLNKQFIEEWAKKKMDSE